MDWYLIIKALHIISAAVLFGTGAGIAFFMLRSHFTDNIHEKFYAARNTVLADYLFTAPAVIAQPVPVTVRFQSDKDTKSFHFNRTFNFKNAKPYAFKSRMVQIKGNEVIEIMCFGLGWKMLYLWDGEKVVLKHQGYALWLFGHFIPVPLTMLMGEGYAEEVAVDDDTFDMITHITHPWWGKVYEYKGRFKVDG